MVSGGGWIEEITKDEGDSRRQKMTIDITFKSLKIVVSSEASKLEFHWREVREKKLLVCKWVVACY